MTHADTANLLRHLATKPGHDEVKADFRDLLVKEFGVELSALDFERRVPFPGTGGLVVYEEARRHFTEGAKAFPKL